jgi:hypothetical protein
MNGQTNLTGTEEEADKAGKVAAGGGLPASSALSSVPVKLRRAGGAPAAGGHTALPGFGPDPRDPFRFTWWNARVGAAVWIQHRERWRAGVVVGLGRKRAAVAIEAAGFKRIVVAKSYGELRRRR